MKSFILYAGIATIILGWWFSVFLTSETNRLQPLESVRPLSMATLNELSPLKRETLHQALNGDFDLMSQLITTWSAEAQNLINAGIPGIKSINTSTDSPVLKSVTDDNGNTIKISQSPRCFLPQTYLASTVLLALLPPEQIIALPKGLRDFPHIYPRQITEKIPLDIDRYNSEIIYQAHPDLAFVAHYSNPATLEALTNQGIPLFMIKHIDSVPEIINALFRIGQATGKPQETSILLSFIEAAMSTIDNRLRALTYRQSIQTPEKILFLHYCNRFSLPTTKNLTGQLLQRLNQQTAFFAIPVENSDSEWKIPVDQEYLVIQNPNALIISCMPSAEIEQEVRSIKSLKSTNALRNQKIIFIDEMIQQSLTQHLVLSYFDIFHAFTEMYCQ